VTFLDIVLFLPLVGFLLMLAIPKGNPSLSRMAALVISCVVFLVSIGLIGALSGPAPEGYAFAHDSEWITSPPIRYHVGLDGLSLWLVLLTTLLTPISVLASWKHIDHRVKEFYAFLILLEFGLIGVFVSLDLFLFYVFWEVGLVPMYFLIGIWGHDRRIYAAVKFFIYTFTGSVLMLGAIIFLYNRAGTFDYVQILSQMQSGRLSLSSQTEMLLFLAFFLAFAIKVPLFPLHTWLPDAHVEAPAAGSVILAGVLLKMGTYGFMKLGFPLFPDATRMLTPVFITLSVISVVYGACLALVQTDIKKIIAYSSISHLGYVMLGLVTLDLIGIQGAIVQMVSHGLVAGGLFMMVGMIYERCHTRDLAAYGGLAKLLPVYAVFFMILTLASIGLPTTSGFTGEFLVLLGAFRSTWPAGGYSFLVSASAVIGVVLGALYMLWFAQRFLFGKGKAPHQPFGDLTMRERAILAAIVLAIFALGLFPDDPMRKTELAARQYQQLVAAVRTGPPVAQTGTITTVAAAPASTQRSVP
jgi:NADH-quinone oxidoreductase subunit M